MNKDDQAKQPLTQAGSVSAEPVDLNKTTPPPPDQSAQATESVAESSPLVEGKGEKSEKSAKSEQPVKKKKPWSAPVLQFLDEEEETDGRLHSTDPALDNPDADKTSRSPSEFTSPTSFDEYSPS